MRIALFYHSLLSDWNHGNAHFLRGVVTELLARGHRVSVYEPRGAWSVENLLRDGGQEALDAFFSWYPTLRSRVYDLETLDLEALLEGVDLVIAHEWSAPALLTALARHRASHGGYRLLFHDTHHRSLTDGDALARLPIDSFDGVLAFGETVREMYRQHGWSDQVWTWHEAADTRIFRPIESDRISGDLIWIGNWGDDERTAELDEFLFQPARDLGLRTRIHGVRYPRHALDRLALLGIEYGGWLANFHVPETFARYRATVHVPRRPYVEALRGIPTIRPFEALACGIPLVSAPWEDSEGLFNPGRDYLVARDGAEMRRHLRDVMHDPAMATELACHGHQTILSRHTCAHRVNELLAVGRELGLRPARTEAAP